MVFFQEEKWKDNCTQVQNTGNSINNSLEYGRMQAHNLDMSMLLEELGLKILGGTNE